MPVAPLRHKRIDVRRRRFLAVHENRISPRQPVRFRAPQRLTQAPARNQGLNSSDDAEVVVTLRVLARLDLTTKLIHIRERLRLPVYKRIRLRENLVLDAHAGDSALL